jgi:DNA-binding transcriptional LysR family regulator
MATVASEGVAIQPRHRATDVASALMLVAAGLGITIMPAGWQPPHFFGIACRPLREPIASLEFAVVHRPGGPGAAVARLLVAARAASSPNGAAARTRPRARAAS